MVTKGDTIDFPAVLQSEHESINRRRHQLGRGAVEAISHASSNKGPPIYDTVGLALSGGGIRSAAISLGVLQALNKYGVLVNIDYLSTVSGGGFIGSFLTAAITSNCGNIGFGE